MPRVTVDDPAAIETSGERVAVAAFLSAAFVTLVVWHAWLCDDAFVTFRTVDNFVNGYGLRWNIAERVQGFTHPLWALLLSVVYFFTREVFYSVFAVSAVFAFVTVLLVSLRLAVSPGHAVVAVAALSLSHAVVEYSTSGLENTLTHVLLAWFAWVLFGGEIDRPRFQRLMWLMGALMLNRLDAMWLVVAPVIYSGWIVYRTNITRSQLTRDVVLGLSPLLLWLVFAVIYFGFPLPNTAYAKLNTGIPAGEIWHQGFLYAVSLLNSDPASVLCLLAAVLLAVRRGTPTRNRVWLLGALLYVVYTIRVGGDFMQGRFFSAPVVIAAISLSRASAPLHKLPMLLASVGSLALIGLALPRSPSAGFKARGIADERDHYIEGASLLSAKRGPTVANHEMSRQGAHDAAHAAAHHNKPIVYGVIGMYGFQAGPRLHIVDNLALTDPLLSRLPAKRDYKWRIGHFDRVVPEGYLETLEAGRPRMKDKRLGRYYAALHTVIAGPVWTWERWRRIWQLNTGGLDHLIDHDFYRHPDLVKADLAALSVPVRNGTAWDQKGVRKFRKSGIEINLFTVKHSAKFVVSLDSLDRYEIVFMRGTWVVGTQPIEPSHFRGMYTHRRQVPGSAVAAGYDRIRIYPVSGKDFSVGHLLLD